MVGNIESVSDLIKIKKWLRENDYRIDSKAIEPPEDNRYFDSGIEYVEDDGCYREYLEEYFIMCEENDMYEDN